MCVGRSSFHLAGCGALADGGPGPERLHSRLGRCLGLGRHNTVYFNIVYFNTFHFNTVYRSVFYFNGRPG